VVSSGMKLIKRLQQLSFYSRLVSAILLLSAALALMILFSLSQGSVSMTLAELWQAFRHQGSTVNQTIFWDLRFPRVLAALAVGAALGVAGALLQGMLRNSLASPFLLGLSAGAGLVAVVIVSLGLPLIWVPIGAWFGSIVTVLLVYFLARTGPALSIESLVLAGVAVSALFTAIQSTFLLLAEDGRVQAALTWLTGSLNGRGWQDIQISGPYILVALVLSCLLARSVNLLSLGDELAIGLGVSPIRSRCMIGLTATLLAAGAVSISGLVGFVGLLVPHGVRLLVGTDYRVVLPCSAIGGAVVLSFADLVARSWAVELPVGIVTAVMGAPVFLWLLHSRSSQLRSL